MATSEAEQSPNILVTGGGGYIGAVLVGRLLEQGYRVRVLDALFWGKKPRISRAR